MKTWSEVWELIDRHVTPAAPVAVPLGSAQGLVLAQNAAADRDLPPFDTSPVDGFVFPENDPSASFEIVAEIRPGRIPGLTLHPGQAARILTGAPLPHNGLRLVMQEDTAREGNTLRLTRPPAPVRLRRRAEDAVRGATLVPAGTVITPGTAALLASVGLTHPLVYPAPRTVHATSGDEIVAPSATPEPGQLRDANGPLVQALLAADGVSLAAQEHWADDLSVGQAALARPLWRDADLLLLSGGASVGDHDFARPLLRHAGYELHTENIAVRPGKPLVFATRGNAFAFALPGNPVSHFVCYHLFVRRALARRLGRTPPELHSFRLAQNLPANPTPRDVFHAGILAHGVFTPASWNSSGDLTALARVNALALVSRSDAARQPGDEVRGLPCGPGA